MPNRSAHVSVAVPLGAGFAMYKARSQNGLGLFLEGVGGAFGGMAGGVLPDLFDPPRGIARLHTVSFPLV